MADGASTYWQEGWVEGKFLIRDGKLVECELEFTPTGRKEEEGGSEDDLNTVEIIDGDATGRVEAWLREL